MAAVTPRVIEQLYAVPPHEFTRERDALAAALAKQGHPDQAREVRRLRRPSASLWAVNQLAHAEPSRLGAFLDAVAEVRRAQLRDPRAAAEAAQQQRGERDALVERAGALLAALGPRPTPATLRRIASTLLGAAADHARAQELRQGRLTHELDPPGFEVLAGLPGAGRLRLVRGGKGEPGPRTPAPMDARRARVDAEHARRRREADELERAALARQAAVDEARREADELAGKLTAARRRLREAQRAAAEARAAARRAQRRAGPAPT